MGKNRRVVLCCVLLVIIAIDCISTKLNEIFGQNTDFIIKPPVGGVPGVSVGGRKWNLIYILGYISDRWITGDRVHYFRKTEIKELIENAFGQNSIRGEFSVPPWSNNIAFQIKPE